MRMHLINPQSETKLLKRLTLEKSRPYTETSAFLVPILSS